MQARFYGIVKNVIVNTLHIVPKNFSQRVGFITLLLFLCITISASLLMLPAILFPTALSAQSISPRILSSQNLYFERFSYEQGLSESNVTAILQDRDGFVWIGTTNGLNRFDGYKFSVFRHNPADSTTLINNAITTLYEDRAGRLWIGTQNGFSIFDRKKGTFTNFHTEENAQNTLSNNIIRAFVQDSTGTTWIGTKRGLNRFNEASKTFTLFKADKKKTDAKWRGKGPTDNEILALRILPATPHILWIGARTGGINALDLKTMKFAAFPIEDESEQKGDNASIDASNEAVGITNGIAAMTTDAGGNIWIGARSDGSVFRFNPTTRTAKRFRYGTTASEAAETPDVSNGENRAGAVHSVFVDAANRLWVGTRLGLWMLDEARNDWTLYRNSPTDVQSLSDNDVNVIAQDRTGVLWFGTQAGGISKFAPQSASFQVFKYDPSSFVNGLVSGNITALAEKVGGKRGEIWLATPQGLSTILPDGTIRLETGFQAMLKNNLPKSKQSSALYTALTNKPILSLLQSRTGTLWIGTERGLIKADEINGEWVTQTFSSHSNNENMRLSDDIISALVEDKQGNIWAGTQGGGVNVVNPSTNMVSQYLADIENPRSLSDNFVFSMLCDEQGIIWIGTSNGLNRFDAASNDFTVFQRYIGMLKTESTKNTAQAEKRNIVFPDVPILAIHKQNGIFWLGTLGGGLYQFDPVSITTTRFGRDENLPSETIYGIQHDVSGNLWLGTSRGLAMVRFQKRNGTNINLEKKLDVQVYNSADGLHSNTFRQGASLRTLDGQLVFGVGMGLVRFSPDKLLQNKIPPQVGFTKFRVFGNDEISQKGIVPDTIEIDYDSNFEIEYAALDFTNTAKNEYAYYVEGISEGWVYQGVGRTITGTSFAPGKYAFHIKASNSDGIWNEEGSTLTLIVRPPWWRTWWFITIASFFSLAVIIGGYKWRVRSINRQNERLTKLVEQRTYTLREQSRLMEAQATEIQLANGALQEKNVELEKILAESEESRAELQRAYTLLDAENARKTQELEEARTFQVSMLPTRMPDIAGLDIACAMRTATEVGGDYYDYVIAKDGTITLAIGDATGHGVRAGMLVSLVKSSFHALSGESDIGTIVGTISQTIKHMNLQRMFMCLTLIRLRKRFDDVRKQDIFTIEMAGAGMPPILHYVAARNVVEQLRPRGIALGVIHGAEYPTQTFTVEQGDLLLLTSDGLIELFNESQEELGLERLQDYFIQLLQSRPIDSSKNIISGIDVFADEWRGNATQLDDIAQMVIRIGSNKAA